MVLKCLRKCRYKSSRITDYLTQRHFGLSQAGDFNRTLCFRTIQTVLRMDFYILVLYYVLCTSRIWASNSWFRHWRCFGPIQLSLAECLWTYHQNVHSIILWYYIKVIFKCWEKTCPNQNLLKVPSYRIKYVLNLCKLNNA